jgi:hypothetical protein
MVKDDADSFEAVALMGILLGGLELVKWRIGVVGYKICDEGSLKYGAVASLLVVGVSDEG